MPIRKYFNWIHENVHFGNVWQGNIRVFCRVRPLLGEELLGSDGTINHMAFPDADSKLLELEKMSDAGLNEVNIPDFFSSYFIRPIYVL